MGGQAVERSALKRSRRGARRLVGMLLVAVVAPAVLRAPSAAAAGVDTSRWPAFLDPAHGFGFRYPPGYRVRYYGPNAAMREVMEGKPVTGGEPPARQTVGFTRRSAPGFFAVVYGPPAQISPQMAAAGQCGSRSARHMLVNRIVRISGLLALERRQVTPDGRIRIDYCFGSGGGNLVTVRAEKVSARDAARVDGTLRTVLSTVRLFPPR